jgi:V/A-type H+-transporting ATPase subunit I
MALTPEKLARFRIVVPSEHEGELLSALYAIADVHLEEPFREEEALPELLVEVLEGKVTPTTLDMEEALSVARRVLRADDPLLRRIEEKFAEYERLQVHRALLDELEARGVPPSSLRKELYGSVIDVALVSEERAGRAAGEFLRAGCAIWELRLSTGDRVLLLTYPAAIADRVEEIKKAHCMPLDLPQWFSGSFSEVRSKLEEEELRVRKETLEALMDVASALRDAIEFERVSRGEALENALRAVENVRRKLPQLEDILLRTISLYVTLRVSKEGADALKALGIDKSAVSVVRSVLSEERVDYALLRKAVGEEMASKLLPLVKVFNSLPAARQLILEAEQVVERGKTYYILCGDKAFAEELKDSLRKTPGTRVVLVKEHDDFYGVLLEGDARALEELTRSLRKKHSIGVLPLGPEDTIDTLRRRAAECMVSRKIGIIAGVVYAQMLKLRNRVSRIVKQLKAPELDELWQLYSSLKSPGQPTADWHTQLKNIITSSEEAISDIENIDSALSLLPEVPFEELPEILNLIMVKLKRVLQNMRFVLQYSELIEITLKTRALLRELRILRERRATVVEGYIPARDRKRFEEAIRAVPHIIYFRIAEVPRSEQAPTYIRARGLRKYLYGLTALRGIPSYWEIDPTPFFTALFVVMYGMMFGDVGQGLVLALFGAWLLKTRYRLLGISEEGAASVGALALLAGVSGAIFGALYGFVVFLKPLAHPIISPIHNVYEIIAIALCFGVAQLLLAMTLNIINLVRAGDTPGAVFSGMGGMGILFYSSGAVIAYHLATSGFNLSVLAESHLQPFVYLLLFSLLAVMGFGFYEWKSAGNFEKIMHAVSEVLEMLLALPANSLSYIRLAAFAMAHEAFGILAENMSPMIGELAGYFAANFLVFAIEALAVGIQAMRLLYYEFSTKFFRGEGVEFKPLFAR